MTTRHSTPPEVLFLDVMDTLVVDPFFDDDLGDLVGCARADLLAQMTPDLWPKFERNELSAPSYYQQFFKDGRGIDGQALEAWMEARYRWVPGMEQLLSQLHAAEVPMYALSNYPVWWRLIEAKLSLSRFLKWGFVSCDMGVRKPAAEAYLLPCRTLGIDPSRCLFVDDRESNCDGARAVGMRAVCFKDTSQLREALDTLGVKVPDPR